MRAGWSKGCYESDATGKGFEPSRAEPIGFRVRLLNHSDTLPVAKSPSLLIETS